MKENQPKYLILSERAKTHLKNYMPSEGQFGSLACFFQNLADSTRLKIISCLSLFDMCVNDICTLLSLNQTTVSHQLAILKSQGIVSCQREGKLLIYSLSSLEVGQVLSYASESL